MINSINDIFSFISNNKKRLVLSVILVFFTLICNAQNWDIDLLKEINLHRNRSLDQLFKIIKIFLQQMKQFFIVCIFNIGNQFFF